MTEPNIVRSKRQHIEQETAGSFFGLYPNVMVGFNVFILHCNALRSIYTALRSIHTALSLIPTNYKGQHTNPTAYSACALGMHCNALSLIHTTFRSVQTVLSSMRVLTLNFISRSSSTSPGVHVGGTCEEEN